LTTDDEEKKKATPLLAAGLVIIILMALVIYGIYIDAKKTENEVLLHKYDFELLESWKGNYRLMEAVNTRESENKELAAYYEGQTVELNQYKNVVVAITEDMIQLNQEITLE
jgi:hypothetical protein